jgi:hypothetical protein
MMRLMLFGVTIMLAANNVLSAESHVLRHEFDGGWWDFDFGSIVIVNDTLRKSEMSLNLTKPLQDQETGEFYDKVVFSYEHDCKADRLRVVDNVSFRTGKQVKMARASSLWQPAVESFAQKYTCSLVKKPGAVE